MAQCFTVKRHTLMFTLALASPSERLRVALANSAPGGADIGFLVSVLTSWIFFVQDCSRKIVSAAISTLFFGNICLNFFELEFYFQIDAERTGCRIGAALVALGVTGRKVL